MRQERHTKREKKLPLPWGILMSPGIHLCQATCEGAFRLLLQANILIHNALKQQGRNDHQQSATGCSSHSDPQQSVENSLASDHHQAYLDHCQFRGAVLGQKVLDSWETTSSSLPMETN